MQKILLLCVLTISILSLPSFAQTASSESQEPRHFKIQNTEILTINSKVLKRKYDIFIKLPYDYLDTSKQLKEYPVLFLNDAPHTFKVAAGVTHFKSMDKAIVVALGFAHGENGQYSRVRDLTPVENKEWTRYQTGGAPKYLEFIEKEVFPFIEKKYRIDSTKRILSGHSLGGSFGVWVLLKKPELFSAYILTSPSLWFKNHFILDVEKEYSKNHPTLKAHLYMATGALETPQSGLNNNMVSGHIRFIKQLRSHSYLGLSIKDEIVEGTDHYSTYPVGLSKGLKWAYQSFE